MTATQQTLWTTYYRAARKAGGSHLAATAFADAKLVMMVWR